MAARKKPTPAPVTNAPMTNAPDTTDPFNDADADAAGPFNDATADADAAGPFNDATADADADDTVRALGTGFEYGFFEPLGCYVATWHGERRVFDTEEEVLAWYRAEAGQRKLEPFELWLTDERLTTLLSRPAVPKHVVTRGPRKGHQVAAKEAYAPDERAIKIARTRALDGASLYLQFLDEM
jgi:hypothetical protein